MHGVAAKSWCLIALMVISLVGPAWGGCCCLHADEAPGGLTCADDAPTTPPPCCCGGEDTSGDEPESPTSDRCDCSKACCAGARPLAPTPRAAVIPAAATLSVEFVLSERFLTPRDVHLDLLRPPQA